MHSRKLFSKRLYCFILLCFLLLLPVVAVADQLVVGYLESFELETLELEPGERGEIVVHLKTTGPELDGFRVSLVRDVDNRVLKTIHSGPEGVVSFAGAPAGEYTVVVREERGKPLQLQVGIGDVILKKMNNE